MFSRASRSVNPITFVQNAFIRLLLGQSWHDRHGFPCRSLLRGQALYTVNNFQIKFSSIET